MSGTINEKTKVPLGWILTGFCVAAGVIWWAATLQSKVDSLLLSAAAYQVGLNTAKESDSQLDKRVTEVERQIKQLVGAPSRRELGN
jgi:hypothetical protein